MIVIIDYNVGNVRSVCNAFRHIGCEIRLSNDATAIRQAHGLVLPGVAAFGYAISQLGELAGLVREAALSGKPLLGICVGFQMLLDESCEHGRHKGLSLVGGRVVPIPPGRTIPHMGWNLVELPEDMGLFAGLGASRHFYFAHSYYAEISDPGAKVAYTEYGFALAAAVEKGNVYGVQFHPEKSGRAGLQVLENFTKLCRQNEKVC